MPVIEIQGVGPIQFPDTMSEADLNAAAQHVFETQGGRVPAGSEPKPSGFIETLKGMGSRAAELPGEAYQSLKTLLTTDPRTTLKGLYENQLQQFDKAGADAANGRYSEMVGHGAAGLMPLLGPAAASIGEDVGTGDPRRMGRGITDAAVMALSSPTGANAAAGAAKALGRGALKVAKSPAAATIAGAGIGGLADGWQGALVGAAGGGKLGQFMKVMERLAPGAEEVADDVKTAVPTDRYMPNRPTPGRGTPRNTQRVGYQSPTEYTPEGASGVDRFSPNTPAEGAAQAFDEGVSDSVRSASGPQFDRFAPNTPASNHMADAGAAAQAFEPSVDRYMPNQSAAPMSTERALFNTQAPEVFDTGESVGAPGFDLGDVTPMGDVPMSQSRMAELAAQALSEEGPGFLNRQPSTHADWVNTDAVPYPRSKTLRSDESVLGLARELDPRIQGLKRAPYPTGTDEVARALRQRARIGGYYGPQEALEAFGR